MKERSRTPLVVAVVLVVVAVAGLAAVLLTRESGDESDTTATTSAASTTVSGDVSTTAAGEAIIYGAVEATGTPLPEFTGADDPAIGLVAPTIVGTTYTGEPIEIVPGEGGPMMLVFLAHWCPHCNAEIPVLNQWRDSGAIPGDLQVIGVSTGVSDERPNFPPAQWLAAKGWTWPALADDANASALQAYGGPSFPYFVVIGADGTVKARNVGELPVAQLTTLVDAALT